VEDRTYTDNVEAIEAWNTVLFDKFLRFRHIVTGGLGLHGEAILEHHPVRPGQRVLDVGCGFGDTTITIARAVGESGEAVGVDAAARFLEVARRDAAEAGVRARFVVADVERESLGGPFDRAFARFGTMFFASPVAALKNVRRALAPKAPFTFVVWRKKEENAWLHEAELRVLELVKPPAKTDAPTCGPGPFSMASPDVVSAQLKAAGFERATFERVDAEIKIGKDVDDAVDFAMALGPAGEILRLAGAEGEKRRPEVVAALRELLGSYARKDGVWCPSSSWLVSALATN
jgi:ubiquinone/menaquinone biosynthesis C-methylase UbiE